MTTKPNRLQQKLEQFAYEHKTISKNSLRGLMIISMIWWVGSWGFGSLVVEEMISACNEHTTFLQTLGLNLDGINKYCSNTSQHTYLTTSIIELVAIFGLGFQAWFLTGFSYKWIRRLTL